MFVCLSVASCQDYRSLQYGNQSRGHVGLFILRGNRRIHANRRRRWQPERERADPKGTARHPLTRIQVYMGLDEARAFLDEEGFRCTSPGVLVALSWFFKNHVPSQSPLTRIQQEKEEEGEN